MFYFESIAQTLTISICFLYDLRCSKYIHAHKIKKENFAQQIFSFRMSDIIEERDELRNVDILEDTTVWLNSERNTVTLKCSFKIIGIFIISIDYSYLFWFYIFFTSCVFFCFATIFFFYFLIFFSISIIFFPFDDTIFLSVFSDLFCDIRRNVVWFCFHVHYFYNVHEVWLSVFWVKCCRCTWSILENETVWGIKNILSRAIVVFEMYHFCTRKAFFK